MTRPISPAEVATAKNRYLPEVVFDVVNKLIAENFTNGRARILQPTIVAALVARGLSRHEVFDKGYLNFEEAYEAEGWKVEYDKPGYDETYDANFTFTVKP